LGASGIPMPRLDHPYHMPDELVLGTRFAERIPVGDQLRQRTEVAEVLARLKRQPGVVLADEVGMGKTFVALAVAYAVARHSPVGPVILMVPPNLVEKWKQDFETFCTLYLVGRKPVFRDTGLLSELRDISAVRYGIARHSVQLLRYLDDHSDERCHLIFLAQGSMGRRQTDKWVRLAVIGEALRRHGRGKARRLIQVKQVIHRYVADLMWAMGEQRAQALGDQLWTQLLHSSPQAWRGIYNAALREGREPLNDDPVPKSVQRAIDKIDLRELADALERMPIRQSADDTRMDERIGRVRKVLRRMEEDLWAKILAKARWRSPLFILDEAHHLKNPNTQLARRFQSRESEEDLRTGDGALARVFDRMLFLTATPFQLGHRELVRVLERFGDIRWDDAALGQHKAFEERLKQLEQAMDDSQRSAIGLQRAWSKLTKAEVGDDVEAWWAEIGTTASDRLTYEAKSVLDAFVAAKEARNKAQEAIRPWILRHNKEALWVGTQVSRRRRLEGCAIKGEVEAKGLLVPPKQLLPFFLAARSAVQASKDLLGEALSSSYEAFRLTRESRAVLRDEMDTAPGPVPLPKASSWYLREFDLALQNLSAAAHPKLAATVDRVVDLWDAGEKVLVFAFYRHTCRALRIHISREIEKRIMATARRRLAGTGREWSDEEIGKLLETVQRRYFDDADGPGRRAVDSALREILHKRDSDLEQGGVPTEQREQLVDVMRRFLRVTTTLARCFPIDQLEAINPEAAVAATLGEADITGVSWNQKFDGFVDFVARRCTPEERALYLEAAKRTQTGGIRVEDPEQLKEDADSTTALANVQVATGETRRDTRARLMRAFNTPFFPDVFVCSEVMGEGVDLQRFCRHVIHHDLSWNPSDIEQRTGRIDRLGCKAEGRHPIYVYLPYVAGAADERQFRVMADREKWFRVVMGQDEVARLISEDEEARVPLPTRIAEELSFELGVRQG
jgi:hypothetical protein